MAPAELPCFPLALFLVNKCLNCLFQIIAALARFAFAKMHHLVASRLWPGELAEKKQGKKTISGTLTIARSKTTPATVWQF